MPIAARVLSTPQRRDAAGGAGCGHRLSQQARLHCVAHCGGGRAGEGDQPAPLPRPRARRGGLLRGHAAALGRHAGAGVMPTVTSNPNNRPIREGLSKTNK
eukprot:1182889-Prorocentrum_minimum.AAC.1